MLNAVRITEHGNRAATLLTNDSVRLIIDDWGGMVPEFSIKREAGFLNTHWVPIFRGNSGETFCKERHENYWGDALTYNIAGCFPCAPSFGPTHYDGNVFYPTHGWAAGETWQIEKMEADSDRAYVISRMEAPKESNLKLSMSKIDMILEGQNIYYSALTLKNGEDEPFEATIGYHNTLGSHFLQPGCKISTCSDMYATPPLGGEFDFTGRIATDCQFDSLENAPMRDGTIKDISIVPPMIGYSDIVSGRIPEGLDIAWSCVSNPQLQLAYVCFFNGSESVGEDEIGLRFNDLWLQYGGRDFTPWAPYDGAPDSTYCIATENAIGAFATGLKNAKKTKEVMGTPTTFIIPPFSSRTLLYGTALVPYCNGSLDNGLEKVERTDNSLVLHGKNGRCEICADSSFKILKSLL